MHPQSDLIQSYFKNQSKKMAVYQTAAIKD